MLTALLLSLALSATGDVETILKTPETTLDAAQKTKLGAAVLAVFPSATPATVTEFYCSRDFANPDASKTSDVYCWGRYTATVAESAYVDLAIQGVAANPTAHDGGVVTYSRLATKTKASALGITEIAQFLAAAFSGVTPAIGTEFHCARVPDAGAIKCRCAYVDTVTPATYATLAQTGHVVKPLRRVP